MVSEAGEVVGRRRVVHSVEGVVELLAWVREQCGGKWAGVAVATETPHGAVVEAFLAVGAGVWSINPKQLERFRDRASAAVTKNDPRDAWVAATALRTDRHCYTRVEESTELVVELRELGRLRERLGEQLRRVSQQLRARLFEVWPELLELSAGADEPWLWSLLEKTPSPMVGPAAVPPGASDTAASAPDPSTARRNPAPAAPTRGRPGRRGSPRRDSL